MIVTGSARRMSPSAAPDPVVLIISSAYNSLPAPGNRVGTGDAANMPTIQASTGNNAIKTADGAHHYRLVGLNIKAPSTLLQEAAVKIGGGETTLAEFPTDITIDRCIVQGDATNGLRRGVQLDGIRCALIDSYVKDAKEVGADTQAVWAYNTPGPLKIVNNYLEGAGENIMFGGAGQGITDVYPADIEIRRNYIFKPTAWTSGSPDWQVKNHVEFKSGSRVLFEGNVLENCPAKDQNGDSILVAPKEGAGGSDWNRSDDVTIRYNEFINVGRGILVAGRDTSATVRSSRVTIAHNLLDVTGYGSASMAIFSAFYTATDLQIEHNTGFINVTNAGRTVVFDAASNKNVGFVFKNNIMSADFYGVIGSGTATGTPSLDGHCSSWTFTNNALIGGSGYTYPANTWYPTSTSTVGFEDFAGGDYRLDPTSDYYAGATNDATDGTDLGADIATLNTKIANTVDGQWGSEPSTYTDRTYTNAELPRTYVDTTYRAQTGTTWNCATAAEFTTALAGCALGDTIVLTAGNTFTGSFTLRNI